MEEAFDGIFGEQCLQLGMWGDERTFLRFARTQRCALIAEANGNKKPSAIGNLHRLPVQDASIDSVLLPHTLDYSDRPHEILREADRVLTSHGNCVLDNSVMHMTSATEAGARRYGARHVPDAVVDNGGVRTRDRDCPTDSMLTLKMPQRRRKLHRCYRKSRRGQT
mgnify:CR=1 FL=1